MLFNMNNEICRLCLVSVNIQDENLFKNTFSLLELEKREIKISDAVMECTSVNITPDDSYSKLICIPCSQNLQTSYLFRQTCIVSDTHLKETCNFINKNEVPSGGHVFQDHRLEIEVVDINDCNGDNNVPDSSDDEDNLNLNELKDKIKRTCTKCKATCPDLVNHTCLECNCTKFPRGVLENLDKVNDEGVRDKDIEGNYCAFCRIEFQSVEKYETHCTQICSFQHSIEDLKPPYVCSACQKTFQTKQSFQTHLRFHSSKFPGIGKTRKRKIDKMQFSCAVCSKKFSVQNALDKHELTHSQKRPYVCEICEKGFKKSSHLSDHRKIHNKEKNFSCSHCHRSFITNSALRQHIFKRHAGLSIPPPNKKHPTPDHWKCRFCNDIFTVREEYTSHILEHKKNQTFICEDCGTVCKSRSLLHSHRKLHLGKSQSCLKCTKKFRSKSDLKRHELSHTDEKPYQCELCGQQFKWKIGAWRHMMRHKGERPKKCEFCDKSFIENGPLKRHMRVHTGERPNICHICYRSFKEKTHLKTHMLGVHKGETIKINGEKTLPSSS